MSQPSVTAFFNTRKRGASDDIRGKSKVLVLQNEETTKIGEVNKPLESAKLIGSKTIFSIDEKISPVLVYKANQPRTFDKINSSVVRNIQFDTAKSSSSSSASSPTRPKMITRARATKTRKFSAEEGQTDIRESFLKMNNNEIINREPVNIPFEKRGLLSPKKNLTPTKRQQSVNEVPAVGSTTPKKSTNLMDRLATQELSLGEIKKRINKSSRLAELKARIDRFKQSDEKLENFLKEKDEKEDETKPPKIKKFEKIELEVPVSPQKLARSPMKTPTKNINSQLLAAASPQRRLLFEPKETPSSPVKSSPTKVPAYQRFQCLAEKETTALPLPYNYRFLAEVFRCLDTVVSMLFNRKEVITFTKLKPAVQKLLRRNISLEHLAQIHKLYPDAFIFKQEKVKTFGCSSKHEQYELCLIPKIQESSMGSTIQLERRRIFYNILLDRVKDEHEEFLLNLEKPMIVSKDKINRWHPEFDVENCKKIEEAELPQPPSVQKQHSAQDVLEKAKSYFGCNGRMEEALERLAKKKQAAAAAAATKNDLSSVEGDNNIDGSIIDTPPATPSTKPLLNPKLKGIPTALLEKIRAKQAAKALEAMTRTPKQDILATRHSRLPEMAKILHNIFVTESKKTLNLNFVIEKLDNSYRTKLSPNELEEHIKIICEKRPEWMSFRTVRKIIYLHLDYDMPVAKNINALEKIADSLLKA